MLKGTLKHHSTLILFTYCYSCYNCCLLLTLVSIHHHVTVTSTRYWLAIKRLRLSIKAALFKSYSAESFPVKMKPWVTCAYTQLINTHTFSFSIEIIFPFIQRTQCLFIYTYICAFIKERKRVWIYYIGFKSFRYALCTVCVYISLFCEYFPIC